MAKKTPRPNDDTCINDLELAELTDALLHFREYQLEKLAKWKHRTDAMKVFKDHYNQQFDDLIGKINNLKCGF